MITKKTIRNALGAKLESMDDQEFKQFLNSHGLDVAEAEAGKRSGGSDSSGESSISPGNKACPALPAAKPARSAREAGNPSKTGKKAKTGWFVLKAAAECKASVPSTARIVARKV